MATKPQKRIKKKDHELLSDTNILHVSELLSAAKPITKKDACDILNISYNTARLSTIIENFKIRKENERVQREKNRGKPASDYELSCVISGYLRGEAVSDISSAIFRSSTFVKAIIERLGVPQKVFGDDKYKTSILPDECVSQTFKAGQIAWSAVYHSPCEIVKEVRSSETTDYEEKYGCKVYNVYVLEPLEDTPEFYPKLTIGGFHATSPAYNLGSLEHLKQYDIKLGV
jgi:hypothetical protein